MKSVRLIVMWVALMGIAHGHHGVANFDLNKEIEISGTVTKVDFINPHSWLYLDVTGTDGQVAAWRCELRGATVLRRSGWTPEMFAPGTPITISGAPDRFEKNTCYLGTAVFGNGNRIDRYGQIQRPTNAPVAAPKPAQRSLRLANGQPNISGDWASEQRMLTDPRGMSGAFLPMSVAQRVEPGSVPEGTQAFPGTRGTAVSTAADPIAAFWDRPSAMTLTEAGARAIEGFDGASTDNPRLRCETTNILFDWTFEADINRIAQHDDRIILQYGSMGLERTVHMNVAAHPPDIQPSRAGHSIGSWEGDVLVVDTVGFAPGILSADGRVPHSDRLHVVERFSLDPANGGLRRSYIAEDPLYFEGDFKGADIVFLSDLPYQGASCDDRSYKSEREGEDMPLWIIWASAGLAGAVVLLWWVAKRRRSGTAGLAALLITLGVFALHDTTAAQNDVLRVNTRLVEVDVVVRDNNGPVTNLTKDDFTIFDNGKAQNVEVFSVSTAERSKPAEDVPLLPAGVVSNRHRNEAPTSATVILFDRLNTADRYQRDGLLQLLAYLKSARREDLTAIYVLGDDLKLIQDFTNDVDRLVRTASKMEVGDLPGVENRTVREIAQSTSVGRVTRRDVRTAVAVADFSEVQRRDPTEEAIESIARHLSAVPGRKSLIWMSAGIPLQISSGTSRDGRDSQIGRATRLLTDANIAVYPIDTRGLRAPDPPRGGRGRLEQNLPPDVMLRLADGTGGRAFYFNNDLANSIRTAISDAEVSYTLGFYPSENGFDGKFHNLSVNVARKDVEVRHRSGYFAVKDEPPNEKERRSIMAELLSSPLDGSQIGLQAGVESVPTNAKAFRIFLRIETSDLHLERRNDRWAGTLDLAIRVESSKQKTVQVRSIPIDMAEESFRAALTQGLVLQDTVTTDRPADRVRIVLQDRATGFAGSLWVPLVSK
jgi:VWFA-related protein